MILISYDISNDKTRLKLSKLLEQNGRRLQKSVFEIEQPKYISQKLVNQIKIDFQLRLKGTDSILITPIAHMTKDKIIRMGAKIQAETGFITIVG